MPLERVDARSAREVRRRAGDICEFCRMPQSAHRARFAIDHIIARQHGGATTLDNLALACLHCNLHKGPNVAGIDPATGQLTPLFDPRQQRWVEHFDLHGAEILGRTAVGRTTISVLNMNDPDHIALRESLLSEGLFPLPVA